MPAFNEFRSTVNGLTDHVQRKSVVIALGQLRFDVERAGNGCRPVASVGFAAFTKAAAVEGDA